MEKITGESYAGYLAAVAEGMKKHAQHSIVGERVYTRVLRVSAWPEPERPMFAGYLLGLHTFQPPQNNVVVETVYQYRHIVLPWEKWFLKARVNRLEKKVNAEKQPDPDDVNALKGYQALRKANYYGSSGTVDVWMYIVVRSIGDPSSLDEACRLIENLLKEKGMQVSTLLYEQQQAFRETFILGHSDEAFLRAYPGRIVHSEAPSALYPCLSGSINDGRGAYVGHSVSTGCANFLNLKASADNQNILIVGASGEGKSVLEQALSQGMRLEDFLVIVFDMNGEYKKNCQKTGGLYIDLTGEKGEYLDPMAIPPKTGILKVDSTRLLGLSRALRSTISILAGGITPGERNAADRALRKLFEKVHIDRQRPETWEFDEPPFNIRDWFFIVKEEKDADARSLVKKLDIYFDGMDADLFKTPIQPVIPKDCNLVVFRVGESLEDEADANIGAAKTAMAMSFVRATLQKEKLRGQRYTAVIFDESQRLLLNKDMSLHINNFATMIRHLDGLVVVATNKPHVLWVNNTGGEGGSGIWANSKYKIFFWVEDSEIAAIEKNAGLPPEITNTLKGLHGSNQFLIRHGARGWDQCKIYLPPEELELYKTRRTESSATASTRPDACGEDVRSEDVKTVDTPLEPKPADSDGPVAPVYSGAKGYVEQPSAPAEAEETLEERLLMYIANLVVEAGDDEEVYLPGAETITREMRARKADVLEALKKFEAEGWISPFEGSGKLQRRRVTAAPETLSDWL